MEETLKCFIIGLILFSRVEMIALLLAKSKAMFGGNYPYALNKIH
jgi:hypothetical protein